MCNVSFSFFHRKEDHQRKEDQQPKEDQQHKEDQQRKDEQQRIDDQRRKDASSSQQKNIRMRYPGGWIEKTDDDGNSLYTHPESTDQVGNLFGL